MKKTAIIALFALGLALFSCSNSSNAGLGRSNACKGLLRGNVQRLQKP